MPTPFSRSSSSSGTSSVGDAQRLVSSRCPECGAPVDFRRVPRHQTQVKCSYCGTLIAIPGRTPPPHPTPPTTIVVSSDGSVVKGGWGCSAAGWLVIILIIFGAAAWVWTGEVITSTTRVVVEAVENDSTSNLPGFQMPSIEQVPSLVQSLGNMPRLATAPYLLGGNDNAPTQMVVAAYQDDGAVLMGFDPAQRVETWRSQRFSERYYEMGIGADAVRVYAADGATFMALDRGTGQILWQTSLANNLQTGCNESHPCLQAVGDQVITLARDGTLQGFAGATGAPLWSRRLNSQPRQFMRNNDQIIVVDNDDKNRAVVWVLNGTNGDVIHELQPSCSFPNIDMRPHSSDQYLITPDGSALLVVSSGTYACAWRYSLSDGALTWQYTPSEISGPLPFTWSMSSLTVADPVIYFISEDGDFAQVYALDTRVPGATPQLLYEIEDYDLAVLYPVGDLLLVSATPGFASDEVEVWAIHRNNGERTWQRKLGTTHTFDEWVTHPTDQGLFVMVCSWENDDCAFEVLDLATGTSKGQVREATGTPFSGAAWRGNTGFLTIDGKLYALDLRTAAIEYTWP